MKYKLKNIKAESNSEGLFTYAARTAWDETSLARIYDIVSAKLEGGEFMDVVSYDMVSFNPEDLTITVEIVIDPSDAYDEVGLDEE